MPAESAPGVGRQGTWVRRISIVAGLLIIVAVALAEREPTLRALRRLLSRHEPAADAPLLLDAGGYIAAQIGVTIATVFVVALCWRFSRSLGAGIGAGLLRTRGAVAAAWGAFAELPLIERAAWVSMIGAFAIQRLVDAVRVPLHCDEIRTFFGAVAHGPLVCFTVYRDPNNHVLHSILSSLTVALPLPSPLGLRLPGTLACVAAVVALAALLRRHGPALAAVLGVIALAALPPVIYYGSEARGYSLCLLFAVLGVWATAHLVETHSQRRWRALFVVACGLGAATIPTHVYCVGALVLVRSAFAVADRRKAAFVATWVDGALSGALSAAFYSGIFARSGVSAVTGNKFVRSRTFADVAESLPRHVGWVGRWMLGSDAGSWLLPAVIVTSGFLLWRVPREQRRLRVLVAVALAFALSVIVFPLAQRVVPPARNWIHITLAPALCIFVAAARSRFTARPLGAVAAAVALAAVLVSGELGSRTAHHLNRSDAMLARVDEWLEAREIREVFAGSRLAANSLRFHAGVRGHERAVADSGRWNPTEPDLAFEALGEHPSVGALVSELAVPPPAEDRDRFEMVHEDGDFGVWVRVR